MPNDVWIVLGWGATVGATTFLVYALFARRIALLRRTKRRCPKCWYDLSHTEGLQCPECGRTWKRESALYTGKRRRLAFVGALLLFALAVPARRVEEIAERGWFGGVPTTILVALTPISHPCYHETFESAYDAGRLPELNWRELVLCRCADELLQRRDADALWSWQRWWSNELLIRQAPAPRAEIANGGSTPIPFISRTDPRTPLIEDLRAGRLSARQLARIDGTLTIDPVVESRWPAGTAMTGTLRTNLWIHRTDVRMIVTDTRDGSVVIDRILERPEFSSGGPSAWSMYREKHGEDFGPAPNGRATIPYRARFERAHDDGSVTVLREMTFTLTIVGHGAIEEYVTPVSSPTLDAAWRAATGVLAICDDHITAIQIVSTTLEDTLAMHDIDQIAATLEVRQGQSVLASADAWWEGSPRIHFDPSRPNPSPAPIGSHDWWIVPDKFYEMTPHHPIDRGPHAAPLTLHVTSDPAIALRDHSRPRFWDGDITIPLRIEDDPRNAAPVAIEREAHRDD